MSALEGSGFALFQQRRLCYRHRLDRAAGGVIAPFAGVVELVDTLGLGPSGASHGGSSPFARTIRRFSAGVGLAALDRGCNE